MDLPTRWVPSCGLGQFMGVQSVGQVEMITSGKFKQSETPVVCLTNAKSSECSCPVCVGIQFNFGIPILFYDGDAFLGDFSQGKF